MFKAWCYVFISLLFLFHKGVTAFAQDQAKADSLVKVYESGVFQDELFLLYEIAISQTNPDDILHYANLLIDKASSWGTEETYLVNGYLQRGNGYKLQGKYSEALEAYFHAVELAQRYKIEDRVGVLFISIGDTYSTLKNYETADNYYEQGIQAIRNSNDSLRLATALLNDGDRYFYTEEFPKAMLRLEEAKSIFSNLNYEIGFAYALGNLGMVYSQLQKYQQAKENLNQAIQILYSKEDYYPISVYYLYLSKINLNENDFENAFINAQKSLNLAEKYHLMKETTDASQMLFELHNQFGDRDSALFYHLKYIAARDSVRNLQAVEEIAEKAKNFEVNQKQMELNLANQKYRNQKIMIFSTAIALIFIGILAGILYRNNSFIRKTNRIIENERSKSDHLLKNILPEETVNELKEFGKVNAKRFDAVSVMFTDFKNFTSNAEHLAPEDLVKSLDYYFSYFDQIVEKYKLEKIKTLGDSYMCASGLPFPQEDHAERIVLAAMEMFKFVEKAKQIEEEKRIRFDMRIGISSGPVVAGIVGSKKFAYDIWGDTVNCASRMEYYSGIGKINITEYTYELIKDKFLFSDRGEIYVKNKGKMKMYFVEGMVDSEHSEVEVSSRESE
ncbi:tetratricopeptide repeat protein [Algoriphagus lutimaris]|uniref:adenylate/guanylate cyclase domain-containing protein n=1 Tax=Algoriphagus lutimaris TaxID=613197 RepID=UPI00196AA564|nr:adenylate/guanylate cyclase domain-containing protein [Algoriphagus lutimaris]MBN3519107.1 tetratricopeptide repeat protein [Algoriphagus lutimaris]